MIENSESPLPFPWQKSLVRAAQLCLATAVVIASVIGSLWLLKNLLGWLSPAIWPVVVAGVLSVLLKPAVEGISQYLHLKRPLAVGLLYLSILSSLIIGLWFLFPFLIKQLFAFIDFFPQLFEHCRTALAIHAPELSQTLENKFAAGEWKNAIPKTPSEAMHGALLNALREAGIGIASAFETLISWVVMPIYLFYFLLARQHPTAGLDHQLTFIKPQLREDIVFLVNEFINILVAFFRGQLLIGLIVGCMLSVFLTLAGLKFGAVLGLLIGLCNVLPYVGTILGITVALPLAFFQPDGGLMRLGIVFGVFFVNHLFEAYVLAPRIMGERTGLHPAAIIFSLFFWGTVFASPLGVLLAIPLSAFWVVAWRLMRKKYLPHFEVSA